MLIAMVRVSAKLSEEKVLVESVRLPWRVPVSNRKGGEERGEGTRDSAKKHRIPYIEQVAVTA